MSKKAIGFLVFFVFLFGVAYFLKESAPVQAQVISSAPTTNFGVDSLDQNLVLSNTDIRVIIAKIIRVVLGLLGLITLCYVLYAGYLIMTSAGNEDKITKGKETLTNAVIGLTIILSAFGIVQFVLNQLAIATGIREPEGLAKPIFQSFEGSGSLGNIIQDHYPFRDQVGIPRNAKISITFSEPIDPTSFIEDTNQNGTFGDCLTPEGKSFDWSTDCDRLNPDVIEITPSGGDVISEVAALALYAADGTATIFTLKPLNLLGSDVENVVHTVDITNRLKKADGKTGAFDRQQSTHYEWSFEVSTEIDINPPTVSRVFPEKGSSEPRNSIVKVTFSEPMDPISVSGVLDQTGAGSFTDMVFGNLTPGAIAIPKGEWRVTNGYKTAEFVSNESCGENSCGDSIYCLPLTCADPNDTTCTNNLRSVVRTAQLVNPQLFDSIPFTGVTDMAGNALDGNADLKPDGKPSSGEQNIISGEEKPDNFLWNFTIRNEIDRKSPYIRTVMPYIDSQGVEPESPLLLTFNKELWEGSVTNKVTRIEEFGSGSEKMEFWFAPRTDLIDDAGTKRTLVTIQHRVFGPNGLDLYYIPAITHEVRDVYQNCFYPGYGPNDYGRLFGTCNITYNTDGTILKKSNCTPVNTNSETDTGCASNETSGVAMEQASIPVCVSALKAVSTFSSVGK